MLESVPASLLADLQKRHAEPQRHYHDWTHVEALLRHMESLSERISDKLAVLYAVLFHDSVYDPKAKDNERQSARLLVGCSPPISAESLALAENMILATDGHILPANLAGAPLKDCAHFLDMDLAILGAPEERFDIYEAQIRREYEHVSDHAFRDGRSKVLEHFSERYQLYFSEWGKDSLEAKARANIARSLKALAR